MRTTVISGEGTGSSTQTDFTGTEARQLADFEVSSGFNPNLSPQQLAPIGTPPAKDDVSADLRSRIITSMLKKYSNYSYVMRGRDLNFPPLVIRSLKTSSLPIATSTGQNCVPHPDLAFKDKNVEDVQTSLDSWEGPGINQPVCPSLLWISGNIFSFSGYYSIKDFINRATTNRVKSYTKVSRTYGF